MPFPARSRGSARVARSGACRSSTSDNLRVLVDSSAVEVFANDGARALATRWFPVADGLTVSCAGACAYAAAYPMGDGMQGTYA